MSYITTIRDTLQNFVSGLGMIGIDPTKATRYILEVLDRNVLENMYRGDWLARKIIDAPSDDMTKEWRAWQANQKQIEALEAVEKLIDLQRKVKQWLIKSRLYGGAALVLGVDDGNDPSQEIDLDACDKGCLKYVVVLNRWELNAGPRIYNVSDPYYTRAAYYTIATPMFGFEGERGVSQPAVPGQAVTVPGATSTFSNFFNNVIPFKKKPQVFTPTNLGMTQIHPSRVLEMPGNELPDWRLAPLGGGWGDSVLQTVVDTMTSFTTTVQSISAMVSDGKLDIVHIPDMALNLLTPGYQGKLIERFALSAQTKSVISALLLDKEEEWQRVTTNYAGLPMIMHEFCTLISGASGIPVTRLFGQAVGRGLSGGSTGGGSSGGDSDLKNYDDTCSSEQKNEITPRLKMLDEVLKRTALGKDDPNIHYNWNPLRKVDESQKAMVAYNKAQSTQIYASIGIINEDAFREGVVNQLIEDGTYPGLDDAIKEFGSEPEEIDMSGYQMPAPVPGKPVPTAVNGKPAAKQLPKPGTAKDASHPFYGNQYVTGETGSPGAEEDMRAAMERDHVEAVTMFMKSAKVASTIAKSATHFAVASGIEAIHYGAIGKATEAVVFGALAHLVPEAGLGGVALSMAAAPMVHHGIDKIAAQFGITPKNVHQYLAKLSHQLLDHYMVKDADDAPRDTVLEALQAFTDALDAWRPPPVRKRPRKR